MSIPKEPRQQMINMMYIVLTALLALNVSAEVLNAFKLVSDGMNTSNNAIVAKNAEVLDAFKSQANSEKKEKAEASAKQAQALIDEFIAKVETMRYEMIAKSGGWRVDDEGDSTIKDLKNYNDPTAYLINQKKGEELKSMIDGLRENLLNLPALDPAKKDLLASQMTLSTEYNEKEALKLGKKSWAEYNFDHVPVVAINTLFDKFKGDALTSGGLVIETLFSELGKIKYDFNALAAQVFAPANYILSGQDYKAEIFITASNKDQQTEAFMGKFDPSIEVRDKETGMFKKLDKNPLVGGGTKVEKIVNGRAIYEEKASGVGDVTKTGVIRVPKPNSVGEYEFYPFELTYQSAQAGVVVSPDKMNVFYIGVDNPVSVSVPGFSPDKVSPSMDKGSITKATGTSKYTVRVTAPGETNVTVSATLPDGTRKVMGTVPFRIKRVPDPVAMVGTFKGGKVPANKMRPQRGVLAVLENFDFDIRFDVVSYEFTYAAKRQDLIVKQGTGPSFTSEIVTLLGSAKPGDVIYIDEIKVKGPDGTTRKLPGIVFTLI